MVIFSSWSRIHHYVSYHFWVDLWGKKRGKGRRKDQNKSTRSLFPNIWRNPFLDFLVEFPILEKILKISHETSSLVPQPNNKERQICNFFWADLRRFSWLYFAGGVKAKADGNLAALEVPIDGLGAANHWSFQPSWPVGGIWENKAKRWLKEMKMM